MPAPRNLAEFVVRREGALRTDTGRQNFEVLWQQIARLVIPRKAVFKEQVAPGQERTRYIFDSTAPRSLELFASFLHTLLNNPSSKWFGLVAKDDNGEVIESVTVKKWLEQVTEMMIDSMTRNAANVYSHLHQMYLDLGAFGTSVLYVDSMRGPEDDLRLQQYHLSDCVISVDEHGHVNELHRTFKYTAEQARARWPNADLGKTIERDLQDDKVHNTKHDFIHAVIPNTEATRKLLPSRLQNAPFASIWVSRKDNHVVAVGSFEEFPYMVPRWYLECREIYGRSPALTVLPDIRMINRMKDTMIRGLEKIVDPPLLLPDGGMISPIRLAPGSISFSDGQVQPQLLIPTTGGGIQLGQFELGKVQETIREGFFIPLFITPESPVKTATQVLQEADERNRAVSPMLVRMQAELFDPMIRRIFFVMRRAGVFPAPPAELSGAVVDVSYDSPLVASRRQAESLGLARFIEALQLYAASTQDTTIFDNLDPDEVAAVFHEGSGAPARVMRNVVDLAAYRKQVAEQDEQASQLEAATQGAGAVADLAKAGVLQTQAA
ncbi:MAG: portal protein [Pseudohongiellaceae bacterium]